MSVNMLIIPEDFRKDQFVLKPIVEKMMASLGVRARVQVCMDPLLGGVGEALKWERMQAIVDRYRGMVRMFLLIVDRDCDEGRKARLDALEGRAEVALAGTDRCFLAENAWQELEVWVLAGVSDLPNGWNWREIRRDCNPKENYYVLYAQRQNAHTGPYGGREVLAKKAALNYQRIRQLCVEDVAALEERVRTALQTGRCP
jgi:hypothetical protein